MRRVVRHGFLGSRAREQPSSGEYGHGRVDACLGFVLSMFSWDSGLFTRGGIIHEEITDQDGGVGEESV